MPDVKHAKSSATVQPSLSRGRHILSFLLGIVAAYTLSYLTSLWAGSSALFYVDGPGHEGSILALLVALLAGGMSAVVQLSARDRLGFIAATSTFLLVALIFGFMNTTPTVGITASPSDVVYFLANAGSNPGTTGVLAAILVQGIVLILKQKSTNSAL